jgi:beta-galactosidase
MNKRNRLFVLLVGMLVCMFAKAEEISASRSLNLNPVWKFTLGEDHQAKAVDPAFDDTSWQTVSVPHTLKEVTLHLDNVMNDNTQKTFHRYVGWYRKHLQVKRVDLEKKYFLHFEGVMQTTELWVNGKPVGKYEVSGFDSFHFDITEALKDGDNLITVKVDNRLNENTPPDSKPMDFILFGGLYRDVNLITTSRVYVNFPWEARDAGIRITTPEVSEESSSVVVDTTVKNATDAPANCRVLTEILDKDGKLVATIISGQAIEKNGASTFKQTLPKIQNAKLWSPDSPYLYTAATTVSVGNEVMDRLETRFGIRTFKFTPDEGFFLNGKHLKLVGSNRHQTWPYVGNAVPNSMHRKDAEIIKAVGMNWVRLSHYPHDPAFLDACDELGLLALEEGPTWMKPGNETWLKNLDTSFRSMIRRDRNHPSIIVWNACINHGGPNAMLVNACKEEDYRPAASKFPTTPMDFNHRSLSGGGALTIEHTGHTYPRSRGSVVKEGKGANQDSISGEWQLAMRHWEHVNAAYLKKDNSGLAVWCMFDYNTFHNMTEPGMVHHGVCDLQRIPKESYYWYMSELTEAPMAHIIKGNKTNVTVVSNCDEIELFQDTGDGLKLVTRSKPAASYPNFSRTKVVPDTPYALKHPPFSFIASAEATVIKAMGYRNGKQVAEHTWRKPGKPVALTLETDRQNIVADGSDFSRAIVMAVDANGTVVPTFDENITLELKGPGRLIGNNPFKLRSGKYAILVAAFYETGAITLEAKASGIKPATTSLSVSAIKGNVYIPETLPKTEALKLSFSRSLANDKNPMGSRTAVTDPANFELPYVFGAKRDTWVISEDVMVVGKKEQYPIKVTGGEYQIYSRPYTAEPGTIIPGDAVRVRVRASEKSGETVTATLTIGEVTRTFQVTTK